MSSSGVGRAVILERIRGEFKEMPGLTLTMEQARRLWSLDSPTCAETLKYLVDVGFLCVKPNGAYARMTDLSVQPRRMAKATLGSFELEPLRRVTGG